MKKILIFVLLASSITKTYACAYYDPEADYFNVFAQEIITDKQYYPFLLVYDTQFHKSADILDENTEAWVTYFNQELTYSETDALLKIIRKKHLVNWKNGKLSHVLSRKMGKYFYKKYQEAFDYLIVAKTLQPYMKIAPKSDNGDSWFFGENEFAENKKNISALDFNQTLTRLKKAYKNTKDKVIKQRYAYQIVRFLHYTRNYSAAIEAFNKYALPLKNNSPIYYYTLDQKAGAERGLGDWQLANYDFFQVFIHSKNRKKGAYVSMKLSNEDDFNSLLQMAKNKEEQNMAYFLLAYNDFNNPVSLMEKMYANKADSEILKVLAVRAINQMERDKLPAFSFCNHQECKTKEEQRLPQANTNYYGYYTEEDRARQGAFVNTFQDLITKIANEQQDEFWHVVEAYLYLLDNNYDKAQTILNRIQDPREEYVKQIKELEILCEILKPETITPEFENLLMEKYPYFFKAPVKKFFYESGENNTAEYVRDILANRYMLQNQKAKSFLMNNMLSSLEEAPNLELTKQLYTFYKKENKTKLEQYIALSFNDVGDIEAYFNRLFGDFAMRSGNFDQAKNYYQQAQKTSGISRYEWEWDDEKEESYTSLIKYDKGEYNGFSNIPNYVFGYNVWESYESPDDVSMQTQYLSDFPFIPKTMNKYELATAVLKLKEIGRQKGEKAAKANQLIGNLMYNTTKLGYYRHLFVSDINNGNGGKYHFTTENEINTIYYKNYSTYFYFYLPDAFDLAIDYYKKALDNANNDEQKARILFQMASAEQGNYYQWEAENSQDFWRQNLSYDEISEKEKRQDKRLAQVKNKIYRRAFSRLKKDFSETQTVEELRKSCLYFDYYMKK